MTGFGNRPLTIPTLWLSLALLVAATTLSCGKKQTTALQPNGTRVVQVQSEDPGSVNYDEGSRRLVITYRNGSVYEYTDVPHDVYVGFMAAPARGVYFSTYVKDRYPYRVTTSGSVGSTVIQIQGGESKPAKPPQSSRGRGRGR
jgi:hypothetical protein